VSENQYDLQRATKPRIRRPIPSGAAGFVARSWLWGWPAICHLAVDLILSVPYLLVLILTVVGLVLVPVFLIGVPWLAVLLAICFGNGYLERARLEAMTGVRIGAPRGPDVTKSFWRRRVLDPRPWRGLLYIFIILFWGLLAGPIVVGLISLSFALTALPAYIWALPGNVVRMPWGSQLGGPWWLLLLCAIGVIGLAITPLVARALVLVNVFLARWLLGPGNRDGEVEQLSARVQTLTKTRAAAVDSVEAERLRIERDLHDGPQQRLVAIAMDLGMARERLNRDPDGARELMDKAHSAAKEAVVEMRQVARGIHPPILTDRGLSAALSALAAGSPVPVSVSVDLATRPTPTVEAIAYFCVSEGLTNVAKHARAGSAEVTVTSAEGWIRIDIRDDGVGGADPAGGTGLAGLADRVAAIDGTLQVESPPGGPTVLSIHLPETDIRSTS
jgi:signal transduction histidine kinase